MGNRRREKERVLITGGAGFIGSHLSDYFLGKGYRVIVMDNLLTGSMGNIKHLMDRPDFTFTRHDVTKYIDIPGRIDYVLHFASPASPIDYAKLPIQTLKVGALGTHNALGLAKAKRAVFLLASTSEVYGDPLVTPQPETYWGNVNPIGPRGVYDEAKRFAEAITIAYHKTHGVDTKIVRLFNTFGERMRRDDGRAVPAFITAALNNEPVVIFGNGKQTRSLCYITDVVEGVYRLLLSDVNTPMNLGNPCEMTIMEIAKKIIRLSGSKSRITRKPLPIDDPRHRRPNINFAVRTLNWRPLCSVDDGLVRTINYFRITA
jgi:dTDP-glucose 4,6-dehydratase